MKKYGISHRIFNSKKKLEDNSGQTFKFKKIYIMSYNKRGGSES